MSVFSRSRFSGGVVRLLYVGGIVLLDGGQVLVTRVLFFTSLRGCCGLLASPICLAPFFSSCCRGLIYLLSYFEWSAANDDIHDVVFCEKNKNTLLLRPASRPPPPPYR